MSLKHIEDGSIRKKYEKFHLVGALGNGIITKRHVSFDQKRVYNTLGCRGTQPLPFPTTSSNPSKEKKKKKTVTHFDSLVHSLLL